MNRLALAWTKAMLEAWGDDPPALILLENVPGLPTRAKAMLKELRALLKAHGYVFHASTHDCGEIGGLAQHRDRYLLVARLPRATTCRAT
jgi:site-specific DNA-cytosine methylase